MVVDDCATCGQHDEECETKRVAGYWMVRPWLHILFKKKKKKTKNTMHFTISDDVC